MRMRRCLLAGVASLALLPALAIPQASSVLASGGSGPRQEQPDPGTAAFCLFLGGDLDQCLGYLGQEEGGQKEHTEGGGRQDEGDEGY